MESCGIDKRLDTRQSMLKTDSAPNLRWQNVGIVKGSPAAVVDRRPIGIHVLRQPLNRRGYHFPVTVSEGSQDSIECVRFERGVQPLDDFTERYTRTTQR